MSALSEMAWVLPFKSIHARDVLLQLIQDIAVGEGLGLESQITGMTRGMIAATFIGTDEQLVALKRWRIYLKGLVACTV